MKFQQFALHGAIFLLSLIFLPYFPFFSISALFYLVRFVAFKGKGAVLYTYSLLLVLFPYSQIWGLMLISNFSEHNITFLSNLADRNPIIIHLLSLLLGIFLSYTPCFLVKIVRYFFREQKQKGEFILQVLEGLILLPITLYLFAASILFV